MALRIEPQFDARLNQMLIGADDDLVIAVDTHLVGHAATDRTLGLILLCAGTAYADALRAVIAEENGIHSYHGAVVGRGAGVTVVRVASGTHWQKIDQREDIGLWKGDHQR